MIKYLENSLKYLETDHAHQVKDMEKKHSHKIKELHIGYCTAIEDLKDKNQVKHRETKWGSITASTSYFCLEEWVGLSIARSFFFTRDLCVCSVFVIFGWAEGYLKSQLFLFSMGCTKADFCYWRAVGPSVYSCWTSEFGDRWSRHFAVGKVPVLLLHNIKLLSWPKYIVNW